MEGGIANAYSPLNTDKLRIVPISIDAQTGAVSSSYRFDYDSELALFDGTETLALEYENSRIFARFVSVGVYFLYEAELADYTKVAANKLYIGIPLVGGPDAPAVAPFFVWADDTFIVTLTPTAQDYSGTMDKTVAEINAAYEAGRKIVFRLPTASATGYMDIDCTARYRSSGEYPSFNGYIFTDVPLDAAVYIYTSATDNGTQNTYYTTIYPLAPMS